jgi:predicted CXXCH cytochrome family protein
VKKVRKIILTAVLTLFTAILASWPAYAAHSDMGDRTGWDDRYEADGCDGCHAGNTVNTSGLHGEYADSSNNCQICHKVHDADNARLQLGQTVTEVCQFCHDITGTSLAPYFTGDLPNPSYGNDVLASHRVFGVLNGFQYNTEYGSTTIPGGDAATGGDAPLNTSGQGKLSGADFTCNSCHTPHAVNTNTVDIYLGESAAKETETGLSTGQRKLFLTNRLLKREVNGVDTGGTYGAAWCAGCHQGRVNNMTVTDSVYTYNHPVNGTGPAYDLLGTGRNSGSDWINGSNTARIINQEYVLIDNNPDPAGNADLSFDPRSNKWYAMNDTDPVTGEPRPDGSVPFAAGEGPVCQQCHAGPRDVDAAFWAGFDIKGAGYPTRGTFPHLSTNSALLTEQNGDDFCTNCHNRE